MPFSKMKSIKSFAVYIREDSNLLRFIAASILLLSVAPIGSHGPACLFHWLTGWQCPGCGLTRAFLHLTRGHFFTAIKLNPLSPIVFVIIIFAFIFPRVCVERAKKVSSLVWFFSSLALISFAVFRNIFSW